MALQDLRAQSTKKTSEDLLAHMKSFELDLKFSAGIWFFSAGNSRFHDSYGEAIDIEARLDIAAGLARGVSGESPGPAPGEAVAAPTAGISPTLVFKGGGRDDTRRPPRSSYTLISAGTDRSIPSS